MKNILTLFLLFILILSSCSIPENVKDASTIHYKSQKLFIEENTKFYTAIEKALVMSIDAQISFLEQNKEATTLIAKEATDEANNEIKENTALPPEDKIVKIAGNERKLNEKILHYTRRAAEEIQIQTDRKRKVRNSILVLSNMQNALADSNMKLNEYIQLKRASDLLLEEVKSTFPQLKNNITEFETLIQDL